MEENKEEKVLLIEYETYKDDHSELCDRQRENENLRDKLAILFAGLYIISLSVMLSFTAVTKLQSMLVLFNIYVLGLIAYLRIISLDKCGKLYRDKAINLTSLYKKYMDLEGTEENYNLYSEDYILTEKIISDKYNVWKFDDKVNRLVIFWLILNLSMVLSYIFG